MELLVKRQLRCHTLAIHSRGPGGHTASSPRKKPVGRILVNTPAAFGAMGATTNLFPAVHSGRGQSAGLRITADNVSPMNLVYLRMRGSRGAQSAGGDGKLVRRISTGSYRKSYGK